MFQPHKPKSTGGPRLSRPGVLQVHRLAWNVQYRLIHEIVRRESNRKEKKKNMATKVTKKKTEKPGKLPWQRPNGKLVDDISLIACITELIWRSFDEMGKCSKRPILGRMDQADHALETAGIPTRFWCLWNGYHPWVRTLCTDVEKAKRLIFRMPYRREEYPNEKMYEHDSYLREMGLKAELLFVGMVDQSKDMACPEGGCYAIFRIPGTNRCIVVFLYYAGKEVEEPPIEVENESDGRDSHEA